jgi:nicotinamidase-related amidase
MPISQLDLNAALIVIDLQKGIVSIPAAETAEEIVAKSTQLLQAFRQRNLPVVLVNVVAPAPGRTGQPRHNFQFPPDWTDLIPELDAQPTDIQVSKRSFGAFLTTNLQEELKSRSVTQIFLCGIATSAGVESTARSAFDLGYNVVFVTDAMTDRDPATHTFCTEKIFPRLGETGSTQEVLNLLATQG